MEKRLCTSVLRSISPEASDLEEETTYIHTFQGLYGSSSCPESEHIFKVVAGAAKHRSKKLKSHTRLEPAQGAANKPRPLFL